MPVVASVDYAAKRIYLSADTVDANLDTLAVYREVRALRRTTEAHRQYKPMVVAGGNIPKITGLTYTPAYVQLLSGCRIVPFNTSHRIRLTRDTFTDDGEAGRDCFDRTSLSASVDVDIDVDVQEVEIRVVTTGGSALTAEENAKLMSLPNASTNASTLASYVIESGYSVEEMLRIALAALAGTSNRVGNTITVKGLDGVTDRLVGTVDAENNRTSATYDAN